VHIPVEELRAAEPAHDLGNARAIPDGAELGELPQANAVDRRGSLVNEADPTGPLIGGR
jgi:hypothetical protein